jgi:hypothetical protein
MVELKAQQYNQQLILLTKKSSLSLSGVYMALPSELLQAISAPGGGKIALVVGAGYSSGTGMVAGGPSASH